MRCCSLRRAVYVSLFAAALTACAADFVEAGIAMAKSDYGLDITTELASRVRADMLGLSIAVQLYGMDNSILPTTRQGLGHWSPLLPKGPYPDISGPVAILIKYSWSPGVSRIITSIRANTVNSISGLWVRTAQPVAKVKISI
jgi:hypothetical protein